MPINRQIGPFEILERIGAGGMGEVFKARDTRLGRFVAIKFLPEAASPAARERFQREATAIAALNHPHICTLYEVGDDDGRPYLVLELLEGETLKARLRRGAPAPEQVLDWAIQIADALDAAHRKGILHRDLKPDNVWVSPGGHVKVLDFGLARLAADDSASGDAPTVTSPLTSPGQTMGTIPYMSPEQAKGEALDVRSDLFSFGSVFYELATGRPAFPAKSGAESMAAILKEQPPAMRQVRPDLPAMLEQIGSRCLEKDPDLRFQSAADLRGELKRAKRETASGTAAVATAPVTVTKPRRPLWQPIAALVVIAVGFAWYALMPRGHNIPGPPVHLSFRQLTFTGQIADAVISSDGKFLAHIDTTPVGTSLHLMSVANGSDTQIVAPSSGCCFSPSFSPDGSEVYFYQNHNIEMVPVLGGTARTIATNACSGAGFSPDGSQIAYLNRHNPEQLVLARPDGSQPRVLITAAAGSGFTSQCWGTVGVPTHSPSWSSDGRWIVVPDAGAKLELAAISTADGSLLQFGPDIGFTATDAAWLPGSDRVVFTASIPTNTPPQLWMVAYPGGQLTQLTSDLQGYASVSVAANGQLTLVHAAPQYSLWSQARTGGAFSQLPGGGATSDGSSGLAWTAQGGLIAVRQLSGQNQIWSAGDNAHLIFNDPAYVDVSSLQSAPAGQIVFNALHATSSIFAVNADGTGLADLTHLSKGDNASSPVLVNGGRDVAYWQLAAHGGQTIAIAPLAGGAPRQLWPPPGQPGFVYADGIAASPDGRRLFAVLGSGNGAQGDHHRSVIDLTASPPKATPIPGYNFAAMPASYAFTPDGKAITYVVNHGSVDNLWAYPIAGGKPYAVTHFTDLRIAAYAFSKDGRLALSRGTPNADAVVVTGLGGH